MKQPRIPQRVSHITEENFWSSLRIPPGVQRDSLLGESIALGKAGRRRAAFARLTDWHRTSLADEWELARRTHESMPAPKAAIVHDLLERRIPAWHNQMIVLGKRIDWAPEQLSEESIRGMHYAHWLAPAVTGFIQTGHPGLRSFLLDVLTQYGEAQRDPRWDTRIKECALTILGVRGKWVSVFPAYLALIHTGTLPVSAASSLLRLFLMFGRSLDHSLPRFVLGSNIFSVGTSSLLHLSRVFPEFRESRRWDRKAVGFVMEHARRGFFSDGGNRERVWGYGTMHVEGLVQPYKIARRTGGLGADEAAVRKAIRKTAGWYIKTSTPGPDYVFPTYGDSGLNAHDRLATITRMVEGLPEIERSLARIDRSASVLLKPSGFAIMRNGHDAKATYANVNFGELAGWHSHWDLLSMNVWSHGKPLLEELCRFGPYSVPHDVLVRAPEIHNLLLIDGMVYNCQGMRARDVAWSSTPAVDYFSGYHRAYHYFCYGRERRGISPNIEAKVRRTVLFVKDPGYFVVMDGVRNMRRKSFNRAITQQWHSPRPFKVLGPQSARIGGSPSCVLAFARADGLVRLETAVDFTEAETRQYGESFDRHSLRARRRMPLAFTGNAGFTTLIYPFRGKTPNVSITPLEREDSMPWESETFAVTTPAGRDIIHLNPEMRQAKATLANGRGSHQLF